MKNFLSNEDGQGLGEYALILSLIAAVTVLTLTGLGDRILAFLESVNLKWPS